MRALLIEDDKNAAAVTAMVLNASGAAVDTADCGEDALDLLHHYEYDVVVLDLVLPDMDGYEVLRGIRARKMTVPVVVLSGLANPPAKVKAFGLGADDFISKPIDRTELVARLHAIVRRNNGVTQKVLHYGDLELDQDGREVSVGGTPVELSQKEYLTLELLLLRQGKAVRKEAFLSHLYGGLSEPGARIIDVFVCHLRKKLAQAGMEDVISTVNGYGYVVRAHHAEPRSVPARAKPSVLDDAVAAA
jgi:two-component system cell cycle response regulator CtrA